MITMILYFANYNIYQILEHNQTGYNRFSHNNFHTNNYFFLNFFTVIGDHSKYKQDKFLKTFFSARILFKRIRSC